MARIREKTLKFPGLNNTYTFADEADLFDANVDCAVGEYRIYNGDLYCCTTAHTRAWDASHFKAVKMGNELCGLQTAFTQLENYGNTLFPELYFVNGSLSSGVLQPTVLYRVASDKKWVFDRDVIITPDDGFRFGIHSFGTDGASFVSDSGWQTAAYQVPAGTYFKIVIQEIDVSSGTANIHRNVCAIKLTTYISDISTNFKHLDEIVNGGNLDPYKVTNLNFATNATQYSSTTNYTTYYIPVKKGSIYNFNIVANGDAYFRFAFALSKPAGGVSAAFLKEQRVLDTNSYSYEYTATADGYLSVSAWYSAFTTISASIRGVTERVMVLEGAAQFRVPWVTDMHRGYSSASVHENTIPAYHRAWINGANMVEADARLSSDNVYIVSHDATVTVDGTTYTIASETAETLTSLVLSTDSIYGDCKIPTLESVLRFALYAGLTVNLDCKAIDATTLAKLVVDCGMSGKVYYANTTTSNVATILAVDPNAGFIFPLEDLSAWVAAITDYQVRQRSFAWSTTVSFSDLESVKANGFKYILSNVSTTALMSFAPDVIEFLSTADSKFLNQSYLDSLDLV